MANVSQPIIKLIKIKINGCFYFNSYHLIKNRQFQIWASLELPYKKFRWELEKNLECGFILSATFVIITYKYLFVNRKNIQKVQKMLITTPYVRFEMMTSSQEFNFSSSGNQPFANISRLRVEDKEDKDFISLELNKSVLNYTLDNADNLNNLAFVSNTLSDNNCQFNNVYVLAQSNDPKSFLALSLDFGVNFPKKVRVVYESSDPQNNRETTIDNIDDRYVFVNIRAQSVNRVYVYFLESWAPFGFAYLQKTDFGVVYEWSKDDIIDLIVNEETPYFCTTLPIDTAKLTVYLTSDQFDMLNNDNILNYVSQDQKFKISEEIEDTETGEVKTVNFGTYYLDDLKNESEHKVTFNLSTILSKLDKKDFRISDMYGIGNSSYDVILSIFTEAGFSNYVEIDESLKNEYLKGYIPFMSCRAALQQVLFVTQSLCYDNRTNKILIKKMDYSVSQVVEMDKIFYPYDIEQDTRTSRISYEYFSYFRNFFGKEKLATISVNSTDPLTVNFSKPIDKNTLEASANAVIAAKYTLYADIVPISQELHDITLQAITYLEIKYTGEITAGSSENIKKFDINGVKLLNKDNATSIMNSLAEFNSKMITYKIEYLCTGQETGKYTTFTLAQDKQIIGWLGRQTIDLAHGMVAKAEVILRK